MASFSTASVRMVWTNLKSGAVTQQIEDCAALFFLFYLYAATQSYQERQDQQVSSHLTAKGIRQIEKIMYNGLGFSQRIGWPSYSWRFNDCSSTFYNWRTLAVVYSPYKPGLGSVTVHWVIYSRVSTFVLDHWRKWCRAGLVKSGRCCLEMVFFNLSHPYPESLVYHST